MSRTGPLSALECMCAVLVDTMRAYSASMNETSRLAAEATEASRHLSEQMETVRAELARLQALPGGEVDADRMVECTRRMTELGGQLNGQLAKLQAQLASAASAISCEQK